MAQTKKGTHYSQKVVKFSHGVSLRTGLTRWPQNVTKDLFASIHLFTFHIFPLKLLSFVSSRWLPESPPSTYILWPRDGMFWLTHTQQGG